MTKAELIKYLRLSVNIQDPDITGDSVYLKLSDGDIELFLTMAYSRDFYNSTFTSLDDISAEQVYPIILLAKKDLFYSLATAEAPLYDMKADQNNELKRSQRFDHYMKLITQTDKEYSNLMAYGNSIADNTLTSFDVLLPSKFNTPRNYVLGNVPVVSVTVNSVTNSTIEIRWDAGFSMFSNYKVYIADNAIYDPYVLENPVSESAVLLATKTDYHQKQLRLQNLTAGSSYHILIVAEEKSGAKGYKEIVATTLS